MSGYLIALERTVERSGTGPAMGAEGSRQTPGQGDFRTAPLSFAGTFSATECAAAVALGEAGPSIYAGVSRPTAGHRVGSTRNIEYTPASRWLYEKFRDTFVAVNALYGYRIEGMLDYLLYCEYPEGGQFDWHTDCGEAPTGTRKLSLSVQLSDESDYAGGGLEFAYHGELPRCRGKGTAIVFPAFTYHRVTRVTKGTRRALIGWIHGPMFA